MSSPGKKGLFGRLVEGFRDSLVSEKLEADLEPVNSGTTFLKDGEIEFYRHTRGHTSLVIELRQPAGIPAGDTVTLRFDGHRFRELEVSEPRFRIRLNSKNGEEVPDLRTGVLAEIVHRESVILKGRFEKD